jgi:hypothetical protein
MTVWIYVDTSKHETKPGQERPFVRFVESDGVHQKRYHLACRHHDGGGGVPVLRRVRAGGLT